ncbi:hypothetical protein QYE76_025470 [Lolium multiflorum]|uniref:CCHC-type domain-containing protein n=1 Tax=Lolium multiflorum TaxID=4521 RepID=A0AAD8VX20_LOLMU|nr:hypothetical protein QYE76_025470 [Lolium multiflorum]
MKEVMHTRFVPTHHKRDLFNKLTQLKQSFKSVEEYYKEMHMTMMSANVDEREEQTMARFLNGLNIPVKRIVEFLPYTNMVELLHQATRAERQVREDLASAKSKSFFAARNAINDSASTMKTSDSSSKDPTNPTKSAMKTTSIKPSTSTMSSKASTRSSNITCFKCGAQGHKSFECTNTRVMITRNDGNVDYLSEDAYEALVQAATTLEDEELENHENVLCEHDTSPSLVVSKVLTTHAFHNEDQRNPSNEIFSELDEINAQGPLLPRSFQKTEEETKWGHEVAKPWAARLCPWPAPTWCGALCAPDLPFTYLKPPSRNPRPRATIRKTLRGAAAANPISGIQEIAFGTCRRGDSSPGGLYAAMVASG